MTFLQWWMIAGVAVFVLAVYVNLRDETWNRGLSPMFWLACFLLCLFLWPVVQFELVVYL